MRIPKIVSGRLVGLVVSGLLAFAGSARAQNVAVPTYEYGKPPEKAKPAVEWKVQAKGGLLLTTGNSQTGSGTFALDSSRQSGMNKLSLNGGVAYGRSRIMVPVADAAGMTGALDRQSQTTTNQWKARGRYDRFITENNSAYALAQIGADRIAGKELFGGGQAGYSRQLVKNTEHTLVAELGYDFSYESYVQSPGKPPIDGVSIHSARLFVGELWTLSKETGISASGEALFNLNKEQALNANDNSGGTKGVDAFKDTRLIGKLGVTTLLHKSLSLALGFTIKYDENPAPFPLPSGAMPYSAGFLPFADKVDTLTEATLIYTFL
jgi:hypothetical protein